MKKYIFSLSLYLSAITLLQAAEPNFAETTLRYNAATDLYEVFAKFDTKGPFTLGMSMITIVLPAEVDNTMLSCQSSNGGIWVDLSRTHDENGWDYHGLITTGQAYFLFEANKEVKLFEFKIKNSKQLKGVHLWNNKTDVKQTNDGTDYRSNFYIAKSGYYLTPEVYETSTTAVTDIDAAAALSIFPNPTMDKIQLNIPASFSYKKEATIEILNMEGRVVFSKKMLKNDPYTMELNMSSLPASTYMLQVKSDDNTHIDAPVVKIEK